MTSEAADAIAQVLLHYTPADRIKLLMQAILILESDIDQRGHVTNPKIKAKRKRNVRRVQDAKLRGHKRAAKRAPHRRKKDGRSSKQPKNHA